MSNMAAIEVSNLVKKYKDHVAVNDVSFTIDNGQYVALLGPNGAGKTTMVEMIEGIVRPDSGQIRIQGRPWKGNEKYLKSILGVSFQETRFMDKATVTEILALFSAFYDVPLERVHEVIGLTGLSKKKDAYVENLSGGQKQKLAIGISLLNDPQILLMDEPTTGLDPEARREIWEILMGLKNQGRTLILTTHYMEEAEYLCDHIMIMNSGRILTQGNLEQLLSAHTDGGMIEVRLEDEEKAKQLCQSISANGLPGKVAEKTLYLKSKEPVAALKDIIEHSENRQIQIFDIQCRSMTLDDLFILLAGRHLHE